MDNLLATALRAADAAAEAQLRWAGRVSVDAATLKGRGDFVSHADLEAQKAALTVIRSAFPGHGVMAEEERADEGAAPEGGATEPLWVVDPLDGTANFLHGHPMYAASVAVTVGGSAVAGAVSSPATGERWWGARGRGAFKSGRPIRVSPQRSLEGSLVGTGFPFKVQHLLPLYLEQLGRVLGGGAGVRRGGSAALDLCYLAEGRLDGFWELFLNPWDFAAGVVIVEEAGGRVTNLEGGPLQLGPGAVMGANSDTLLDHLAAVVHGRAAPALGADAAFP